jgi:CRISPR-associated protein (TIGR03986 family)
MRHTPDFFYTNRKESPVIPGSSLRGMVRGLLEIISYGKLDRVTDRRLFFRSVDNSSLGLHYRERMVGKVEYGNKVEAGFLSHDTQGYLIRICRVFRVDRFLLDRNLYDGSGPNMTPSWEHQHHPVWVQEPTRGVRVEAISRQAKPGYSEGRLVITGNMQGKKYEFVFLLPDADAETIRVPPECVERFQDDDQVTQWQEKAFPAGRPTKNCREHDGWLTKRPTDVSDPVFFLREPDQEGTEQLTFFGRAQMFRLPYFRSPLDLVPEELKSPALTDFAEALFGYTDKPVGVKQGAKERAYAGRLFVTDALHIPEAREPWLDDPVLVPKILSTPKPTSFQHYLAQSKDFKPQLEHYGSPDATLRGHKRYWHQGEIEANHIQESSPNPKSTQHTQIKPVRAGVGFGFRIYFENLTREELGALAWTLQPEGDRAEVAHKLGMGKSLGMGSVRLSRIKLQLTDRPRRYATLFHGDDWERGEIEATGDLPTYRRAFEVFLMSQLGVDRQAESLCRIKRIALLLRLMQWEARPANPAIFASQALASFRNRQVLPHPLADAEMAKLIEVRSEPRRLRPELSPAPAERRTNVPAQTREVEARRRENAPPLPPEPEPTTTLQELRDAIVPKVEKSLPKRADAVVVSRSKKGRVMVTLEGVDGFSGSIELTAPPAYPPLEVGDRCRVEVTYNRADEVVSVRFKEFA